MILAPMEYTRNGKTIMVPMEHTPWFIASIKKAMVLRKILFRSGNGHGKR